MPATTNSTPNIPTEAAQNSSTKAHVSKAYASLTSTETNQVASEPVLSVKHLKIAQIDSQHQHNILVNDLSYQLHQGETLAIVGESGSGKSISSLALLGLLPESLSVTGQVRLQGVGKLPITQGNLTKINLAKGNFVKDDLANTKVQRTAKQEQQLKAIRGARIGMIFQEPMTALNPLHTVGKQIAESLRLVGTPKSQIKSYSIALLEDVNIKDPASKLNRYPHELSGGQRQRVMIAMALAQNPDVLIADEPTTALDVSLQHDILQLLDRLKKQHGMAMVLISHDLNLVRRYSDHIIVMQQGKVVEQGASERVFRQPNHDYTKSLISQDFGQPLTIPQALQASSIVIVEQLNVAFPTKKTCSVVSVAG